MDAILSCQNATHKGHVESLTSHPCDLYGCLMARIGATSANTKTRTDTSRRKLRKEILERELGHLDRVGQAATLGIHPATLYRWLADTGAAVTLDRAQRVANILNTTVETAWTPVGGGLTPRQRSIRASIGAHARWGSTTTPDRSITAQAGQDGLRETIAASAELPAGISGDEREKLVDSLMAAHMGRLALRSSRRRTAV